jgi:hypothetical protein
MMSQNEDSFQEEVEVEVGFLATQEIESLMSVLYKGYETSIEAKSGELFN